jgi:hypothetical protein
VNVVSHTLGRTYIKVILNRALKIMFGTKRERGGRLEKTE